MIWRARKLVSSLVMIGLAAFAPSSALGASYLSEFRIGQCLLPQANYDGTVAFAKLSGWTPAPDEYLPLMMPATKPIKFQAWTAINDGEVFIVAASVGSAKGVDIPSCTIVGQADYGEVETQIGKLGATLLDRSDEVVQVTKVYQVERLGNRMLVVLVEAPNATSGIISAGVTDGVD